MKNSKKFQSILIILTLSAMVIFILHYLMYKDIKAKNEKISNLQYDLSMLSTKQDYLITTQRNLQNLENDLAVSKGSIVSKEGEIDFIENIEKLARSHGLTIEIDSLVQDEQALPSSELDILSLRAKASGGWLGTYMFLAEIESMPYKVSVSKASIVRSNLGATTGSVWNGIVEMSVLKYK